MTYQTIIINGFIALASILSPALTLANDVEQSIQSILRPTAKVEQFKMEVINRVYIQADNAISRRNDTELIEDALPEAQLSYKQTIYWGKQHYLFIETKDADDQIKSIYYQDVSMREPIHKTSLFSEWDILHPYLFFIDGDEEGFERALEHWGFEPQYREIAKSYKGLIDYKITEKGVGALWIDRQRDLPIRIHIQIPADIEMVFSDFMVSGNSGEEFYFPLVTSFYKNGMLFKQSIVSDFEVITTPSNGMLESIIQQNQLH